MRWLNASGTFDALESFQDVLPVPRTAGPRAADRNPSGPGRLPGLREKPAAGNKAGQPVI